LHRVGCSARQYGHQGPRSTGSRRREFRNDYHRRRSPRRAARVQVVLL